VSPFFVGKSRIVLVLVPVFFTCSRKYAAWRCAASFISDQSLK